MKIVAINLIQYTGKKGEALAAQPGDVFDVPQDEAKRLLAGMMPAARRMTEDEIELDKSRAAAKAKGAAAAADEGDEGDEDQNEDTGAVAKPKADPSDVPAIKAGDASKVANEGTKQAATPAAKKPAGKAEDY